MLINEQSWLDVVDAFCNAPLDDEWLHALSMLGEITGSRSGELIGLGAANSVPFNWVTNLDGSYSDDFIAMGGGDPAQNPYVRVGTQLPALKVMSSEDFITRHERRHNRFLVEHVKRYDIPYVCLAPLVKESDLLVGLAVLRSSSQGEISTAEREMFTSIAPHVRAAVRMQMSLEHQGAALVAGALEALSLAVFVCDCRGVVRSMTPDAEAMVSHGRPLALRNGILSSCRPMEARALGEAIKRAAAGIDCFTGPISSTLVISAPDCPPLVLDVLPVPKRDFAFGFEPGVLVVVKEGKAKPDQVKTLLMAMYRLTTAEVDVVMRLVSGETPEQISFARNSSVGTVRAQIRDIYSKCGTNRCSELIAKVNQLR